MCVSVSVYLCVGACLSKPVDCSPSPLLLKYILASAITTSNRHFAVLLVGCLDESCIAVCRHSTESWEAVGALARHVVLKAPDKAEYRTIATEAGVALMMQLPIDNQHHFVLFAARLARTPKVRCQ